MTATASILGGIYNVKGNLVGSLSRTLLPFKVSLQPSEAWLRDSYFSFINFMNLSGTA